MFSNLTDVDLVVLTRALSKSNGPSTDKSLGNDFNNDKEYNLYKRLADECESRGINYRDATILVTHKIAKYVKVS